MQVVAVYLSQTALFKTLNLFPPEKALVGEERAKGAYAVLPYFLSKILAELPIAAAYPLVFSAVVYPMTNLQPSVRPPALHQVGLIQHILFYCSRPAHHHALPRRCWRGVR